MGVGCKRVNGYLSLGLILYLLTSLVMVWGNRILSGTSDSLACVGLNENCSSVPRCPAFFCDNSSSLCQECHGRGVGCVEGECCTGYICDDIDNTCECAGIGNSCEIKPCCANGFCISDECSICHTDGGSCKNTGDDPFPCCTGFVCVDNKCVCAGDGDECIGGECCTGNTCSTTGMCQCAGDGDECIDGKCCTGFSCQKNSNTCQCGGDDEDCIDGECCTGFRCYYVTKNCQRCGTENDLCDAYTGCCPDFVCYNNSCKSCNNCVPLQGECMGGGNNLSCCPNLTCTANVCKGNGALSLFNMNFSLKQLVGFAVVMVATGLL